MFLLPCTILLFLLFPLLLFSCFLISFSFVYPPIPFSLFIFLISLYVFFFFSLLFPPVPNFSSSSCSAFAALHLCVSQAAKWSEVCGVERQSAGGPQGLRHPDCFRRRKLAKGQALGGSAGLRQDLPPSAAFSFSFLWVLSLLFSSLSSVSCDLCYFLSIFFPRSVNLILVFACVCSEILVFIFVTIYTLLGLLTLLFHCFCFFIPFQPFSSSHLLLFFFAFVRQLLL